MTTSAPAQSPADITLQQLGGRGRLTTMVGAKHFMSQNDGRTLTFRFQGSKVANFIRITLNGLDYYDITFIKIGPMNRKTYEAPQTEVESFDNVAAEQLKSIFESTTGLYLTL